MGREGRPPGAREGGAPAATGSWRGRLGGRKLQSATRLQTACEDQRCGHPHVGAVRTAAVGVDRRTGCPPVLLSFSFFLKEGSSRSFGPQGPECPGRPQGQLHLPLPTQPQAAGHLPWGTGTPSPPDSALEPGVLRDPPCALFWEQPRPADSVVPMCAPLSPWGRSGLPPLRHVCSWSCSGGFFVVEPHSILVEAGQGCRFGAR